MESQIVSPPFLKEITIRAKHERRCHERFISSFKKVTDPFVGAGLALGGLQCLLAVSVGVQIKAKSIRAQRFSSCKNKFSLCTLGHPRTVFIHRLPYPLHSTHPTRHREQQPKNWDFHWKNNETIIFPFSPFTAKGVG